MGRMTQIPLSPAHSTFHDSPHDYGDIFVQGGTSGLVFVSGGTNYRTAFVECSPAGSFIRGEGPTLAEADDACWAKLQAYLRCTTHDWEPRGFKNGGGFCTKCGQFGSGVFTPDQLGLFCTTCQTPTFHTVSGSGDGEPRCKEHDALWIYVLASIKATFHFPAPGQEKLTESMYQRLRAVRDGGPLDPEPLRGRKPTWTSATPRRDKRNRPAKHYSP